MSETFTTPLVFKPDLAELVLAGKKDVTRRLCKPTGDGGPPAVRARWRVGALAKVYDKPAYVGGVPLAEVRIVSVTRERLAAPLSRVELAREGFAGATHEDFMRVVSDIYGLPPGATPEMWRIEFALVRCLT